MYCSEVLRESALVDVLQFVLADPKVKCSDVAVAGNTSVAVQSEMAVFVGGRKGKVYTCNGSVRIVF